MAHEDIVYPVDEADRVAARGAAERVHVKAQIAHELILQDVIDRGMMPDTPTSEKIQILKELKDITASSERAKRKLSQEFASHDASPRISLFIGGPAVVAHGASALEGEFTREEEIDEMPEFDEVLGV